MKKICALLLIVIVGSCKDDDRPTFEEYLTGAVDGWVFESVITINPFTGVQEDLVRNPDIFPECTLDDGLIFTADGKYTVKTNIKCDPSDPEIDDSGTWTLNEGEARLVMTSTLTNKIILELSALSVDETRLEGEAKKIGDYPIAAIVTLKKKGT